jgi:gentisate 1,2-dioxygenase
MKKKCIIFSIGVYENRYEFSNKFYIVVPQWYQYCLGVDVPNMQVNFSINGNITVATNKE